MATIKGLLGAMIDKINTNEDNIETIFEKPIDSIIMTNGTEMGTLTMSEEKELLFNGEAIAGVANWDELENKPFHIEVEESEILPETEAMLVNSDEKFAATDMNVYRITAPVSVYAGDTYIVTYNGVEYECVAQLLAPITVLGNLSNVPDAPSTNTHNGEPFGIIAIPLNLVESLGTAQIIANDGASSVSIAIRHKKETITKISGKYVEGMGYSEYGTPIEMLPEQVLVAEEMEPGIYVGEVSDPVFINEIGPDMKLKVIFDGSEYICETKPFSPTEGTTFIVFGNLGLMGIGNNNNMPFMGTVSPGAFGVFYTQSAGNYTVAVELIPENVHKIDQKFLPETSGVMVRVDITEDDEGNLLCSKTFAEISDIILAGNIPYCVRWGDVFTLSSSSKMSEVSTYIAAELTHKFTTIRPLDVGCEVKIITVEETGNVYFDVFVFTASPQ